MKKILILGAGIYQVPLIKKAKQMGLYTIVASYQGEYPGFALADEVWEVDTRDVKTLAERAAKSNVVGVITTGTDVAVCSVGTICESLGLIGLSESSARTVTDKWLMKEAFIKGEVATPKAYKAKTIEQAKEAFETIDGPVVIKAVDSSGSRGITKVEAAENIEKAWLAACEVSQKDYVLVEEFIEAHEIGVDGFVYQGKIKFMLPHDKFTCTAKGVTIPEGHAFPFVGDAKLEAEVNNQIERAIVATGLNDCAFNADVLVTANKAYILEIGGRAGATCIPELISIYGNFNYYEQMINSAIGDVPKFDFGGHTACMAKLLFSERAGTISGIDEEQICKLQSDEVQISLDYPVGTKVEAIQNGTSRIGQIIMQTADVKELDSVIAKVRRAVKIDD